MYLNKSNKGIGWYSIVSKDAKGNKLDKGEYINFIFKRGAEPDENVMVADLYLIDQYGNKRPVYAYVDEYNGNRTVKFRILDDGYSRSRSERATCQYADAPTWLRSDSS